MSSVGDALAALKSVVLMQERLERMQKDMDGIASGLSGLKDFAHDLDKRLYAVERVIDLGARQSKQKRIEP
jgi:hypothetical protein